MFKRVITDSIRLQSLGARDHALINSAMMREIRTALDAADWACHVCGVALRGFMEIDHLKGHSPSKTSGLAPICQFCHDLRHPMWAASRSRIFPIVAPETAQTDVSRFSWTLLSEGSREDGVLDTDEIMSAMEAREEAAWDMLGGTNLESVMEALLTVRDRRGADRATAMVEDLDRVIRFVPGAVRDMGPLYKWTREGFRPVPVAPLFESFGPLPAPDQLFRAANAALRG